MRFVSKGLVVLVIGVMLPGLSAASARSESTKPEHPAALAAHVARFFRDEPLGRSWTEWSRSSRARSIPYTGYATNLSTVNYWVVRAEERFLAGSVDRAAYLIGDSDAPTLEFTSWIVSRTSADSIQVFDTIWSELSRRLGDAFRPAPPSDNPVFRGGSAFHKGVLEFRSPRGVLRTYRSSFGYPGAPESIVIEYWGHRLLADAAASPAALGMIEFSWDDTTIEDPSRQRAKAALARDHGALEAAISRRPSRPEDVPAVLAALGEAEQAATETADLLRYAAHLWARDLPDSAKESAGVQLMPYLGEPLEYCQNDSLIYRLAVRVGENRWTDAAFLELMDLGWGCLYCDGEPDVCEGTDSSAPVIEHGEAFLSAHPRSPIWSEVAWRTAMAHETAWTLRVCQRGVPPSPEQFLKKPPVPGDADWDKSADRDRAVELYSQLIRQDPKALRSRAAARRIPRMRLGVGTDYRRYWCFQD